jgi:GINS complex subunit 3
MEMRYVDIDLILSEDERIPCKFSLDADKLGHLDPTNEEEYLPTGSVVDLPLW